MKTGKYPWDLFLFGVFTNMLFHFFWLFIPGVICLIIGIFSTTALRIGVGILSVDFILAVTDQVRIMQTLMTETDNPDFEEFREAVLSGDDWHNNVHEWVDKRTQKTEDSEEEK